MRRGQNLSHSAGGEAIAEAIRGRLLTGGVDLKVGHFTIGKATIAFAHFADGRSIYVRGYDHGLTYYQLGGAVRRECSSAL
jgi:hypothetical protein